MASIVQKIWIEEVLPDSLRANLVTTPDARIIQSATSTYQRHPGAIVLLDHKYPIVGIQNIEVTRSGTLSSNTATISLINMDSRYSGANKHKVQANVPVSIYFGYDGTFLQRFEGFIDTVSMQTTRGKSVITLQCRDTAKQFLEREISAGIYSASSTYLGWGDWHFEKQVNSAGVLLKFPRPWKVSEIIIDICYHLGLRDIAEFVQVAETELPNGDFSYLRTVEYQAEFDIQVDPAQDRELVTNFVEEAPLDCLGKLVQSILHFCNFDTDGRLKVAPLKDATSPTAFYFKEERDIISIAEATNDDDLINVVTVVGQTANETAIIYPFAPVAVAENISVAKGQDLYGQAIHYPDVVSQESIDSLENQSVYAPVIHPEGTVYTDPKNNPENNPQFDTRVRYPNFASGYQKQKVLDASCPIVTDTADWAPVGNRRLWHFYGAIEDAVVFEQQPIMLKDRFGKNMLVVSKERSVDNTKIRACGNTPYSGIPGGAEDTEVPVNIPTELFGYDVQVKSTGELTTTELSNISTSTFSPIYKGVPSIKTAAPDCDLITGWVRNMAGLPGEAPLPEGLTSNITHVYDITTFMSLRRGVSNFYDDTFSFSTPYASVCFFKCEKDITIVTYEHPDDSSDTIDVCVTDVSDPGTYNRIIPQTQFIRNPQSLVSGCSIGNNAQDQTGAWYVSVPYPTSAPAGYIFRTSRVQTITYPGVLYAASSGSFGGSGVWRFVVWDEKFGMTLDTVQEGISSSARIRVAGGRVPAYYAMQGGPDTNCIYWAWRGGYSRSSTGRTSTAFTPSEHVSPIGFDSGHDWDGNARALITREDFYKLAQDPNTTVIELVTVGIDHKSWAEIVSLNENNIQAFGHNLYGNMAAEFKEMARQMERALEVIGLALAVLAISVICFNPSAPGVVAAYVALALALAMIFVGIGSGVGRNVSKVMENMTCTVTGVRREEIHLPHNMGQASTWNIISDMNSNTGAWHTKQDTSEYMKFAYVDDGNRPCWVYIMDVTKAGTSGMFFPDGAWVTAFGWETPEIGDRSLIDYYTKNASRRMMNMSFTVEAFGDDTQLGFSAEYLLRKRFTNLAGYGLAIEPGDAWQDSSYYEVLVDRSMTDVAVSDTGWWWNFFERKDDYTPRIYRYVAVVIYSIQEKTISQTGALLSNVQHVVSGSAPNDAVVMSPARFGFFIPRGLNAQWYNKYRWLENKTEQNYLGFTQLYAGQSQMVSHIYNNFRYSQVDVDIRIWGKAYGLFAPSIVYYKETDQLSIGSYGYREVRLVNNCINDFKTAKYIANKLAASPTVAYQLEVTGKPHIKEGDIVMVKEETTGAVAGMFRTWENTFKSPETRPCTEPGNMLVTQEVKGVFQPQMAIPTIGNNTLIACGSGSSTAYILEIDRNCNPLWWSETTGRTYPSFVLRWNPLAESADLSAAQPKTIVGLRDSQTIAIIDYAVANLIERFFLPSPVLCGCLDEEQRMLYVGTEDGVVCIDLHAMTVKFSANIGPVYGISAVNYSVWDTYNREYSYQDTGVLFCLTETSVNAYKLFADPTRLALGELLASYSDLPFDNPKSLQYDKFIDELVVVNGNTALSTASIHGISVEVEVEPMHPELGVSVEFVEKKWAIDFMTDAELIHQFPDTDSRMVYINRFFTPTFAVRDINKDLLVTDTIQNKVYRVNPTGKLFVTQIVDRFTRSNTQDEYKCQIEGVTVEAAAALQLTNFGDNFLQQKTEAQIEGQQAVSMGRIVSILPKGRFLVKLLTSSTIVEAYNNSASSDLRVHDTVLVSYGYNDRGMCAILGKKALWDWTVETGDPYISIDATNLDISKYGQEATSGTGTATNIDSSTLMARIRSLETKIHQLGNFHGISW